MVAVSSAGSHDPFGVAAVRATICSVLGRWAASFARQALMSGANASGTSLRSGSP